MNDCMITESLSITEEKDPNCKGEQARVDKKQGGQILPTFGDEGDVVPQRVDDGKTDDTLGMQD